MTTRTKNRSVSTILTESVFHDCQRNGKRLQPQYHFVSLPSDWDGCAAQMSERAWDDLMSVFAHTPYSFVSTSNKLAGADA
jgi:hypothetical protein